jgi:MFS family permease
LRHLKFAILSLALLTILMNSAIIPIISQIGAAYPDTNPDIIKLVLTLPALSYVIFSLVAGQLTFYFPKKYILMVALALYTFGGIGSSLAPSIGWLLFARALVGIGTGMISPLVTDLIAIFYEGEERTQMIGFSNAASNLSGIFIPLLAGWLAEFKLQYAFWVYGIGFFVLFTTLFFIPVTPLSVSKGSKERSFIQPRTVWLVVLMNFLVMVVFYTLPTNLSVFVQSEAIGSSSTAGFMVSISTLISTLMGLAFAILYDHWGSKLFLSGMVLCTVGFGMLVFPPSLIALIFSEILIGIGLGVLFPFFSLTIIQVTSGQQTTRALSIYSSSFSLGIFVSPLFFRLLRTLTKQTAIQTEFVYAALLFALFSLAIALNSVKKQRE